MERRDWPPERIAGFKTRLKGGTVIPSDREAISIVRSLPHGHVAAALGAARKIGLDRLIGPAGDRCRDLVLALIVSRVLDPSSKLATARALSPGLRQSRPPSSEMPGCRLGPVDVKRFQVRQDGGVRHRCPPNNQDPQ